MKTYSHKSYYFPSTDLPDDLSLMIGFDELEKDGYQVVSVLNHSRGVKFILKKMILDDSSAIKFEENS